VPTRIRTADIARAAARRIEIELGREVHEARLSSAVSQREAAKRVDMSHSQFGRIERAEIDELTFDQAARACAAVGLRLFARALPGDDPALDAGQLALLARFRRRLPTSMDMPTEVPCRSLGIGARGTR
jgi:transcriptional regulator with XRE-family HTH domain